MKFTLHNAQQGHQVLMTIWETAKPHLVAGHKFTLTIESEKRSLPQNSIIHSIIGQIAKQASHAGAKWGLEDWKRLLVDLYGREKRQSDGRIVPALDGNGIVQLGLQTRNFSKEEASEFVDFLYAWAAQNGVEVSEV